MPDMTAIELEAGTISPTINPRLVDHVLELIGGALFSAALVAGGIVLVTVALMAGVVGSPVLVAAIAFVAVRRRRARALAGHR